MHQTKIIPFIQNGEYFFKKSNQAFEHNDMLKAKKYIERAIQFDPEQLDYCYQLGFILAELGQYDQSIIELKKIVEKNASHFNAYYQLANNYAHLGLFQEAKKFAKTYLDEAPAGVYNKEATDLLDLLTIELDDFNIDDVEDELIIKQEEATSMMDKGKVVEAISVFREITVAYPDFWAAHNNLALACFYQGDVHEALRTAEHVLEQNPGNLHALCNLAIFYHYMNLEQHVHTILIQLEKVYPIDLDQKYKVGATFAITGKHVQAFLLLKKLYSNHYDGDASFYYWLSVAAFGCGKEKFAKKIWEMVIQLNPAKIGNEPWLQ